jgi:hypothetical protein
MINKKIKKKKCKNEQKCKKGQKNTAKKKQQRKKHPKGPISKKKTAKKKQQVSKSQKKAKKAIKMSKKAIKKAKNHQKAPQKPKKFTRTTCDIFANLERNFSAFCCGIRRKKNAKIRVFSKMKVQNGIRIRGISVYKNGKKGGKWGKNGPKIEKNEKI